MVTVCNQQLKFVSLLTQEGLSCSSTKIGVILVFPEDLGEEIESGPSSIGTLGEFKILESLHDGHRGVQYICQIGDSDQMRHLCIFSNNRSTRACNFCDLQWSLFENNLCLRNVSVEFL